MIYKFLFITSFVFCNLLQCYGQKNFSEGYIITLNNDSIHGKIKDYRSSFSINRKAIKINFIDSAGKQQSYLATKLKGYSKGGFANYKSLTDLEEGPFFAKIIIQGPLTLLAESEEDKYIRMFLVHINKKKTLEVYKINFKNGMADYFTDYPELQQKIINKELRYDDLEIIVNKYNEWFLRKE